jgi:hypothetical protein
MEMETLFRIGNLLVLPFWGAMIFLPRWGMTKRVMESPWTAAGPAVIYAALVLPRAAELLPAVMRPELTEVASLLGTTAGATIAWVHFLAFDLLAGRWIYLDSRERDLSVWLMGPILFLTLMLGPFGFLLYLLVRLAARKGE